eukprot:CAMPEP_0177629928 /NCGR_PEP_ID=MMETSP0447-20121125/932_1 /TAXON_ID=0 /ORGANISM="Stygamoeba regulata, Strain BSH-02190019" /LENGTH=492 /DNA_ID=CAMNT_0019131287 /DNA_START=57 /DNA_END=1535 /DNA_ORIENTATION=-
MRRLGTGYSSFFSENNFAIWIIALAVIAVAHLTIPITPSLLPNIWDSIVWLGLRMEEHMHSEYFFTELTVLVFLVAYAFWLNATKKSIYLLDFTVWDGKPEWKTTNADFLDLCSRIKTYTPESFEFQKRLTERTGLGDRTYLPTHLVRDTDFSMTSARKEAEEVVFTIVDQLLTSAGVKPQDIDVLVVNCSLFCPTPSLASMIINKFKMRSNIRSFNLGGMGCSAGVISVDLAKDLLQVHARSLALVVSTENITMNMYRGNHKGMLLSNCLFRCGGGAVLLSNKWTDRFRARYKLTHTVRVHKGQNDTSYHSVYQEDDPCGVTGVGLSKELMNVVGDALKTNMTVLGPQVLPWSEQAKFLFNVALRSVCKMVGKKPPSPYVPDFKKAFEHFCIHAGGRAIIDGLEQNLKLLPRHCEPSRATLYRYGNTSSSSIWYELAYIERMGWMHKGDRVWQIALGSGFKCNSAVWRCLRTVKPAMRKTESMNEIHEKLN